LVDTFRFPCALSYSAGVEGFVRVQAPVTVQQEQVSLSAMVRPALPPLYGLNGDPPLEFLRRGEERRIPIAQHNATRSFLCWPSGSYQSLPKWAHSYWQKSSTGCG